MKLFATITDREHLVLKAINPITGAGFPRALAEAASSLEIWQAQAGPSMVTEYFLLDAQDVLMGSCRIVESADHILRSRISLAADGIDTLREEESCTLPYITIPFATPAFPLVGFQPATAHTAQLS